MNKKLLFIFFSIILMTFISKNGTTKNIVKDEIEKKQILKVEKKKQAVQKADANSIDKATISDTQTLITPNENMNQVITKFPPMTSSPMTNEQINWQIISSGGNRVTSNNFTLSGTIVQTAVGSISSTGYLVNAGFWQIFGNESCCIGDIRGNVDNSPDDQIDISDLVFLVTYAFQDGIEPLCIEEANIDGSVGEPYIDISDIVWLVDYMFQDGLPPAVCP